MKTILTYFALALLCQLGVAEPIIIAHRGASGYLPEHTLEATILAHGLGADFIEQDIVLSKDDVPVVLHDVHLDTTTNVAERFPERERADGRFYAVDFTLRELKTLRVLPRFERQSGRAVYPERYPSGEPGFEIATFEEAIQLIQGLNQSTRREVGIYPEIKKPSWHLEQGKDVGAAVVAMLSRYGYRDKSDLCYVQCFELTETRRLRDALGYEGRLVQLIGGRAKGEDGTDYRYLQTVAGLEELAQLADGIGPPLDLVVSANSGGSVQAKPLVSDAHAAGLVVHPYTARADALPSWANSYEALIDSLFVEVAVDGVFTDFPNRL